MASQWDNFLCNLGEWHGTFVSLDSQQREQSRTSSILTLEKGDDERLVRFGLQRWEDADLTGPAAERGAPSSAMQQDYRTLGKQVVFFPSGTFCKGSQQLAPGTAFGGEFGFIAGDRRHRLVILYSEAGRFERSVLIREFRAGTATEEQPPLAAEQLLGSWQGEEATISADWPDPSLQAITTTIEPADLAGVRWLPDAGGFRVPEQVSHRQAFLVEAWWKPGPDQLEHLIRRYDGSGAWQSASLRRLRR